MGGRYLPWGWMDGRTSGQEEDTCFPSPPRTNSCLSFSPLLGPSPEVSHWNCRGASALHVMCVWGSIRTKSTSNCLFWRWNFRWNYYTTYVYVCGGLIHDMLINWGNVIMLYSLCKGMEGWKSFIACSHCCCIFGCSKVVLPTTCTEMNRVFH